jgi:predicted transcriptional regulator
MTGLWIPEEVLKIEGLDFLSKGLFSQILALKPCYASNSYFAQMFGVSTRTISTALTNLEKMNLIESKINKMKGNSRIITPMENSSIPPMEISSIPMEISSIPMENIASHIKEENKVENKLKTNLKQSDIGDFSKNEKSTQSNDLIFYDNTLNEPQKKNRRRKSSANWGGGGGR